MATFKSVGPSKPVNQSQGHLDESWLECSICLEQLTRNHKVLPCQHTFCLPCLEDIASTTKTKNKVDSSNEPEDTNLEKQKETKNVFLCPECRTSVEVSLDKLPSNVILNRLLEGREMGVAMKEKVERNMKHVHAPKQYNPTSHIKPPKLTQTEKTSSAQCDKYKAFEEAARALKSETNLQTGVGTKMNNSSKNTGGENSMTSSTIMHTDMTPPNIPPPPIPGNLSTNPFVQMVAPESLVSSSKLNLEKENVKESLTKKTDIIEKDRISSKAIVDISNQSPHKDKQNNQNNTAHYELLLGPNNLRNTSPSTIPTLPPRTLSIVPPISTSKFSSGNTTSVQGIN